MGQEVPASATPSPAGDPKKKSPDLTPVGDDEDLPSVREAASPAGGPAAEAAPPEAFRPPPLPVFDDLPPEPMPPAERDLPSPDMPPAHDFPAPEEEPRGEADIFNVTAPPDPADEAQRAPA